MPTSDSLNGPPPPFNHSNSSHTPSRDTHSLDVSPFDPLSRSASQRNTPHPSFFNDAFADSLASPTFNFLDTILNPTESAHAPAHAHAHAHAHALTHAPLPFGYRYEQNPHTRRARSPPTYPDSADRPSDMPSTRQRPARLPNGYVDLTGDPSPSNASGPTLRKRQSPTPGPSAKRQKRNEGSSQSQESLSDEEIEEIDLSDEQRSLQEVLEKQRQETVKAQQKPEEKATTFNSFTCVICMDTPNDITATSCGHLFCHTCLMEALIAGENRSGPNEPKRSQCPVCRKFINRNKPTDIIPLLMKKGLATQPRKSATAASAKVTS